MSTLLLRLAAPLQAWGIASKFDTRGTAREPSKSGVIGMLAAAMGLSREEDEQLKDLAALLFGVRIDQPGTFIRDYHTARLNEKSPPFVTNRHYLADAVFLVGLEGEENVLLRLEKALQHPFYPLYLGRRSCPPSGKLVLGLRQGNLRQSLAEEPWQAGEWFQHKKKAKPVRLTVICDALPDEPGTFLRRDLPRSFSQRHRQYDFRMVRDDFEVIEIVISPESGVEPLTEHDAMVGWEV